MTQPVAQDDGTSRRRVAVLFGGCSEEHPVSIKSAGEVAKHLDSEKYEAHFVGITRDGSWKLCDGPDSDWESRRPVPAMLSPDRAQRGLLVWANGRVELLELDVVFPVLHGRFGEDGAIQGLLELSGIPYVGCDIPSSALCMDKSLAFLVARSAGVATPNFVTITEVDTDDIGPLSYPVFVKPARSGSSFGVSKVSGKDELPSALVAARRYDTKVIVEEAVVGREVGCAVVGNGIDLIVGEVDHVSLSHGFFRIHQETDPELGSANATFVVPADISPDARRQVQETAKVLYRALGCRGLARVDLFLRDDGSVVLNEVNTLPGLTAYSRFPRMMAEAGWSLGSVIDRAIELAMSGA